MNEVQRDLISIQNMLEEYKSIAETDIATEKDFLDLDSTLTIPQHAEKLRWEEDCMLIRKK